MAFSELIKNFDKIRAYMRDFYIYGFKARGDYAGKSARTYDDEKRRIESYLGPYFRWENDRRGKRVSISLDTSQLDVNPLYSAWKAKSFTDNDITLHFTILSVLQHGAMSIAALADAVSGSAGRAYDTQTVRIKANEYVKEGLLYKERQGKTDYYRLSQAALSSLPAPYGKLLDALKFFQETAPLGFIGSTILDGADASNDLFSFKHHYIVHTLEDGVLLALLTAMHEKRRVSFVQQSTRFSQPVSQTGVPLRIFVSVQSGRRYVCLYTERGRRFQNYRLDFIQKVYALEPEPGYDVLAYKLDQAKGRCWGVSFGGKQRCGVLRMTLRIDEVHERYVLERLSREGRGGTVTKIGDHTFVFEIELFDINEMMAWIKSFTGRILSLESSNREAIDNFYRDMVRMQEMYGGEA